MTGLRLSIDGLDLIKQQLKVDPSVGRVIPDIGAAVMKFHNVMEKRVGEVFTASSSLSSVRIGNSLTPEKQANSLLRFSLQYRFKPVPLIQFATSVSDSQAVSSAPLRRGNYVKWAKGQYSKRVNAQIQRGKSKVARAGKDYRLKGFILRVGGRQEIMSRAGRATWVVYPSYGVKGTRANLQTLFGPSLSRLAASVYDNDPIVAKAKETLATDMIKAFQRYYD